MKVSILTRISTSSQSNDSSLNELRSICKKKNYDIVEEYVEVVSGSKGKDERSELRRMLSDCKKSLGYEILEGQYKLKSDTFKLTKGRGTVKKD